jgi:hypothetical protein
MWEPQPLTTLRASKACRGEISIKEDEMGRICSRYGVARMHTKAQGKILNGRDILGGLSLSYLRL